MAPRKQPSTLNPDNLFARLPRGVYQDARWSGKKPGDALRVYAWMLDRTTSNVEIDGVIYGLVCNETPISCKAIAKDLHSSRSSVRRSADWLAEQQFISRGRENTNDEYRYTIVDNKRMFKWGVKKGEAPKSTPVEFLCDHCGRHEATCDCPNAPAGGRRTPTARFNNDGDDDELA